MNLNYDIDNKNLTLIGNFDDNNYMVEATSIFNSEKGIYHKLFIESKVSQNENKKIRFNFERACDKNFDIISEKTKNQTKNVILFNNLIEGREIKFDFEKSEFKDLSRKILNIFGIYKNSLELNEISPGQFEAIFNESKIGNIMKAKGVYDIPFRTFTTNYQTFLNGCYYQVLINKYMYLVIKSSAADQDSVDIYDYGIFSALKFTENHAPIFEISIPESKMLLGFAFDMEI
jgi:hypothetical protein